MTKEEAKKKFLELVWLHGLQWNASVPQEAYDQMAEINRVLSPDEKREALRS